MPEVPTRRDLGLPQVAYNLTFVQLGLIDLGTLLVGMSASSVSMIMAVFAVSAFVVAAAAVCLMDRRGWSSDLRVKLRFLGSRDRREDPGCRFTGALDW